MTAKAEFRGHPTFFDEKEHQWKYEDTEGDAGFGFEVRPCKRCGKIFEGSNEGEPDPCLGDLPGVDNACCGHGIRDAAYVRFTNGVILRGFTVDRDHMDFCD